MRKLFAKTAIGMEASASRRRIEMRDSIRYPYIIESVASDNRERIPLQASATSRGMAGRLMMLPWRNTGTPSRGRTEAASLDASNWSGKVIWLKMMAGMGIIRNRKAQGKSTARKSRHPRKKTISPASSSNREIRDRNNSAPSTPARRRQSAKLTTISPQKDGAGGNLEMRSQSFQSTKRENRGTRNP